MLIKGAPEAIQVFFVLWFNARRSAEHTPVCYWLLVENKIGWHKIVFSFVCCIVCLDHTCCRSILLNSLAPRKFEWNFGKVIYNPILVIDGWSAGSLVKLPSDECYWTSLMRSQHCFRVMAWCHQATSHYLSQCWPRSMSPYGITRPYWVKRTL